MIYMDPFRHIPCGPGSFEAMEPYFLDSFECIDTVIPGKRSQKKPWKTVEKR